MWEGCKSSKTAVDENQRKTGDRNGTVCDLTRQKMEFFFLNMLFTRLLTLERPCEGPSLRSYDLVHYHIFQNY